MDYKRKYHKYKCKYMIKQMLSILKGGNKRHILLDGTSSSGKTTLSKLFAAIGYKHVAGDEFFTGDLWKKCYRQHLDSIDQNEYQINDTYILDCAYKDMYDTNQDTNLVIYDVIDQKILKYDINNNIIAIVVYASLEQLVDNIFSRRYDEPRGIFIFNQFTGKYEYVEKDATNSHKQIDAVNYNNFVNKLKEKLKYEFKSEDDLIKFVDTRFEELGITNINKDEYYGIRLKKEFRCDYLLNCTGKDKVAIFKELYDFVKSSKAP